MRTNLTMLALLLSTTACGTSASPTDAGSSGEVAFYNGPTNTAASLARTGRTRERPAALALADGTWRLTPEKMTVDILAVGFVKEGEDPQTGLKDVKDCSVTYDRGKPSLERLARCDLSIPDGTFVGIALKYVDTVKILFDGSDNGIYSSPSLPNLISTSEPAGGADYISLTPNISAGSAVTTSYFNSPVTLNGNSKGKVSVLVDPTHYLYAEVSGGEFSSKPYLNSNNPVYPIYGPIGRVAYYANTSTPGAYRQSGTDFGFLLMYGLDSLPVVLIGLESGEPCNTSSACPSNSCPHLAFPGDGTKYGTYGYLGVDSNRAVSWAFPGQQGKDSSNFPIILGFRGVYSMPEQSTIGATATVSYQCTSSPPAPSSGSTYTSGAPSFTPDGTITLKLLAN